MRVDGLELPDRAISIRAPWWWFILHGGKRIENRTWKSSFRGPVLIHASQWFKTDDAYNDFEKAKVIALNEGSVVPPRTFSDMRDKCGMFVGTAVVTGCVKGSGSDWFFGPYGFILEERKPLAVPIPCKGALGFFDAWKALEKTREAAGG